MPLTDVAIKSAKPAAKVQRLFDGAGLYMEISPSGGKWWRFKYRFEGKEKRLSLGVYPDIGLKDARDRRDGLRRQLANGVDPGVNRKVQKEAKAQRAADSFETIAREWFAMNLSTWAEGHSSKIIRRLERDIFPWLGDKAITDISASDLLKMVRRIESRGTLDTAHRARSNCSQVFRYAIQTGRAERDPATDLRGALPPLRQSHFASITEPEKVAELLRAMDAFKGTLVVKTALLLSPLLFVRPGELRRAKWSEFDFDKAEWRYFVTKTRTEHLVPLASQAVVILRDLHAMTGRGEHVFPGRDPKHSMSEAAVNAALRRMGYDTKTEITGHGFRAMARTILHEELNQQPEVIEHQLAHKVPDALGAAYNRTKFLKQRRTMMQLWADYLEELKSSADVIRLTAA